MQTLTCKKCGQSVELEGTSARSCPQCDQPLSHARQSQWTILIVPILAILHFVRYVL